MPGYIDIIYDEKVRPYTEYPGQLCNYLLHRFNIKKEDRLLEVGCGRGDFLKGFKDSGLNVCGLDYERPLSQVMLKDIEVRYANLENEPFPFDNDVFDVVFSKSVIEHIFKPENFMKESYRVLKPGGRIVLMTPDWISQMKIFFDDYTHRQPYAVAGVKDALNIFGFTEVSSELFYQLPMLWRYPALKVLSRILQLLVPVTTKSRIKFIRWSVELMILGTGIKQFEKG